MTIYVRIDPQNKVAETFTPPEGVPIADCFHPDLQWVDVTGISPQPEPGDLATENNGTWTFTTPTPPEAPPPTAQQLLAEKLAAGITLTSTGTPALNATYALDDVSTAQIFQIGLYANQFGVFPSGGTTQAYPDIAGTPHDFGIAAFIAFLRAVAPLVSALETQAGVMAQGGTPSWPPQTATIP
jgi:hypothetical protein